MSIDSLTSVLTALGTAVGATALLAHLWDQRRVFGRILLVSAVLLAMTGAAALQVNRLTATYPTWASLLSRSTGGDQPETVDQPTNGSQPSIGAEPTASAGSTAPAVPDSTPRPPGNGRMVRFAVAGRASGLSMPMTVYLPSAYFTPQGGTLRFPVIEALHGYPGTPETWFRRMDVKRILDREIAAGRMAPTVVLFPYQTPDRLLDTECTNLTGGPQAETYLTVDVPRWAGEHLRVRTDRAGWALIGYSAGAFCAMNLALRHPDRYIAGASLSGYADPGIKVGDGSEKTTNNIVWRLTHRPPPPVSLYIAWAANDPVVRRASQRIVPLAKPPLAVTTATVPHGGHTTAAWQKMEAPAFDWLSARLARAEPTAVRSRPAGAAAGAGSGGPLGVLPTAGPAVPVRSSSTRPFNFWYQNGQHIRPADRAAASARGSPPSSSGSPPDTARASYLAARHPRPPRSAARV